MQISEYENIYINENSHFFYVSIHKLVIRLIKNTVFNNHRLKILDAGCGSGMLAKKMEAIGSVIGVDINEEAIKYSKKRGINVKKASVLKLPFNDNCFDIVTSIDVLYHQQVDDVLALNEFYRVLKPGGFLIVRVSAYDWLRRRADLHVFTRERYTSDKLKKRLAQSGFNIKFISYINAVLLPAALLSLMAEKVINQKGTKSPLINLPKVLNSFLVLLLQMEIPLLLKGIPLPFGLGLIAVASKPLGESFRT